MLKFILIISLLFIIPVFFTFARLILIEKLKKFTRKQRSREKKILNNDIQEIYEEERKELYLSAQYLFNQLMKAGKLNRKQILYLKKLINNALGTYEKDYKNKHFENDAHEIYTKMKSIHIDKSDWMQIINYLEEAEYMTQNVLNIKQFRSKAAK